MGSRGIKIALALLFLLGFHLVFWPVVEFERLLLPPLLCGWYELPLRKIQDGFLSRHLPMALACLALAAPLCQALMKRLCTSFLPQQPWSWARSFGLCGLFVSAGLASIGLLVMTHESAWLLKTRATPWSMLANAAADDSRAKALAGNFGKLGLISNWGRLGGPSSLRLIEVLESQKDFHWQFDCGSSGQIENLRLWLVDSPSRGDFLISPDGRVELEKPSK